MREGACGARKGLEMFKDKPVKMLRRSTRLCPNVIEIAVAADSGIGSAKDLEGMGFLPAAVGIATEGSRRERFSLHGENRRERKNAKAEYPGYGEAANAAAAGHGCFPLGAALEIGPPPGGGDRRLIGIRGTDGA